MKSDIWILTTDIRLFREARTFRKRSFGFWQRIFGSSARPELSEQRPWRRHRHPCFQENASKLRHRSCRSFFVMSISIGSICWTRQLTYFLIMMIRTNEHWTTSPHNMNILILTLKKRPRESVFMCVLRRRMRNVTYCWIRYWTTSWFDQSGVVKTSCSFSLSRSGVILQHSLLHSKSPHAFWDSERHTLPYRIQLRPQEG